jgi:hypothetical protein
MDADEDTRKSRLMHISAYIITNDEDYEILRHPFCIVLLLEISSYLSVLGRVLGCSKLCTLTAVNY